MPHQHATATVEVDLKTSPTWTETESHQWALKGSQQTVTPQKLMDVGDMNEKGGCGGKDKLHPLETPHMLPACSSDTQHLHLSLYRAGVHSRLNPWLRSDLYFKGYTWHIAAQTRDISQVNLHLLLIILTMGLSSFWPCISLRRCS